MGSGDPKVSGFQHSFHLRSYLSERLLPPIVSLKHGWVSLNSAVNGVSAGSPVKLAGSAVLYFFSSTEGGGQPVTLEPGATAAILLQRLPL